MTPLPPSEVDTGATNMPDPGPNAPEGVQAVTGALSGSSTREQVEALAAVLEPDAFNDALWADPGRRSAVQQTALAHAAKVITEGFRRVSVDDDTVERVARALHNHECGDPDEVCPEFAAHRMWYVGSARAAVQALRDGRQS